MNKPPFKGPAVQPKNEPAPVTRLDEKLTQLTIKTAKAIQRHRNAVISITAAVVLAILAAWAYEEYHRSQQRGLSSRVFQQFRSKKAEKLAITGAEPSEISRMLAEIRSLIADARGTDTERWVIKEAVDYLIDKAMNQVFPANEEDDPLAFRPAGESMKKNPAPPSPELLGQAEELVREARERFKDDRDLQHWAEQCGRSIQALRAWELKTSTRPFKPVLPPAQEPEPPGTSK